MARIKLAALTILLSLLMPPAFGYGQTTADYLILHDMGQYKITVPKELIPGVVPVGGPKVGQNAGIVGGSHFHDHTDTTYEVKYIGGNNYASPTVIITQHTGVDSDKWLLHEMEIGYRDSEMGRLGLLHKGAYIDLINNSRILGLGIGGNSYRWLSSNNVVVSIKYADRDFTKPEPVEVINAYLAKFPSVIPATFKLNSAHDVEWIKDEMDRRLWLCDKWVAQIQPGDTALYKKINSVVSSMNVFLDYREKYFGLSAKNDKLYLERFLSNRDDASIKTKLQGYKDWWVANKSGSITLP